MAETINNLIATTTTPELPITIEATTPVSTQAMTTTTEATTPSSAPLAGDGASIPIATGSVEGQAIATVVGGGGETGLPPKTQERRASTRKTSLKKKGSVVKKEGEQPDRLDEDSDEEAEVPKIIYPIDAQIQESLRKAWTLFIKKGQKKKTEIAELDIPIVMRSIAINPTETQVKEVIANVRTTSSDSARAIGGALGAQDVSTTSKGFLTYECFEQRMAEGFQLDPDKYVRNNKDLIHAALKTISGGANEMNAADLKKIMMIKGDAMTEQEAALMIHNAGDRDTGTVYLDEYADALSKDGIPQPPPDPTVW